MLSILNFTVETKDIGKTTLKSNWFSLPCVKQGQQYYFSLQTITTPLFFIKKAPRS